MIEWVSVIETWYDVGDDRVTEIGIGADAGSGNVDALGILIFSVLSATVNDGTIVTEIVFWILICETVIAVWNEIDVNVTGANVTGATVILSGCCGASNQYPTQQLLVAVLR